MPRPYHGSKLLEIASKGQNCLKFDRLKLLLRCARHSLTQITRSLIRPLNKLRQPQCLPYRIYRRRGHTQFNLPYIGGQSFVQRVLQNAVLQVGRALCPETDGSWQTPAVAPWRK